MLVLDCGFPFSFVLSFVIMIPLLRLFCLDVTEAHGLDQGCSVAR